MRAKAYGQGGATAGHIPHYLRPSGGAAQRLREITVRPP